jgi:hypothetical protein
VTTTDAMPLAGTSQVTLNAAVDTMLASANSTKTVISDKLGVATTGNGTDQRLSVLLADSAGRGKLRFRIIMSPTSTQWSEYKGATRTWTNIDWPLDEYGTAYGTRRVSCLTEIQMLADEKNEKPAVPFFGSISKVYQLAK